jgi:hypothetical protein
MEDTDIEHIARGRFPPEDRAARERARRRLLERIDAEVSREQRRKRTRRLGVPVAAAAIVALVLGVQALLPPGSGGPVLIAASEIRHLGTLSTALPTLQLGPSSFLYRETKSQGPQEYTHIGTGTYTLNVSFTQQTWLATDGSGKTVTTYQTVAFASESDRAMWEQLGKPAMPGPGDTVPENYRRGELDYFPVDRLPSDPHKLKDVLDSGAVIQGSQGTPANELLTMGILLAQGDVTPDVRAALFELASEIPGVTVQRDTFDPIGRPAVAVSVVDALRRTTLFFDANDASLLADSRTPNANVAAAPSWTAYVSTAVVDRVGVDPGA